MFLWTNKSYRNKGIMSDLISFLVHKNEGQNKIVSLCVQVKNLSAIKCYEKNGFKIIRRVRFFHLKWPFDFPKYKV